MNANAHGTLMWIMDIHTQQFLAANRAALLRYGWSEEAFLKLQVSDICLPEDVAGLTRFEQRAVATRNLVEMTQLWRQKLRSGETFPTEASACRVDFEGRKALLFVIRDLTQELASESRLRQHSHELQERLAEREHELANAHKVIDSFSYLVSHDLRSPLQVIEGFSRELADDAGGVLDAQGRHFVDRIGQAARHVEQLSDEMLQLARVSRAPLQREALDLATVCKSVVEELRRHEPERQVKVELSHPMNCVADAAMLRIMMQQLIGNAWKFTSRHEQAWIRISRHAGADGQAEVYSVADNGAGFDMDHADKLFTAFHRLHSTREFPGTGVGLAIVQQIVHRHAGTIRAESQPRMGSTFSFTLGPPAKPSADDSATA